MKSKTQYRIKYISDNGLIITPLINGTFKFREFYHSEEDAKKDIEIKESDGKDEYIILKYVIKEDENIPSK